MPADHKNAFEEDPLLRKRIMQVSEPNSDLSSAAISNHRKRDSKADMKSNNMVIIALLTSFI